MALETMQGLTPTISITVPNDVDLTEAAHIYFTMKQGSKLLKLTDADDIDIYTHRVDVYLTQENTLAFNEGSLSIQLNWTYSTGQRGAIKPIGMRMGANHLLEVLE